MNLAYHQKTFDFLGLTPQLSEQNLQLVSDFESTHGVRLPAALKEWYSLGNWDKLLEQIAIPHHSIGLHEGFRIQEIYTGRSSLADPFPVLAENQGVWLMAVNLQDSDNPSVWRGYYRGYYRPDEPWQLHAHSFSDWLYASAWDYSIVEQHRGRLWFEECDDQINTYLVGCDEIGPETLLGNAWFKGDRCVRMVRQGERLTIIKPEI